MLYTITEKAERRSDKGVSAKITGAKVVKQADVECSDKRITESPPVFPSVLQ